MMKCKLIRILILGLLFNLLIQYSMVSLAASNVAITEYDAKMLLFNALDFFHNIHWARDSILFDSRTPLKHFEKYDSYYFELLEDGLIGGSYEAMQEYAKTIYTESLASNMYEHNRNIDNPKPMFVSDESGKLYINPPLLSSYVISWGTTDTQWQSYSENDMTIRLISSNSEEAIMWLKIKYGDEMVTDYYWIECKMINTTDGWRIALSPFTLMLEWGASGKELWEDELIPFEASPSTSDPAFDLVFILPTVSVAALASAFCLMRRRKENVL